MRNHSNRFCLRGHEACYLDYVCVLGSPFHLVLVLVYWIDQGFLTRGNLVFSGQQKQITVLIRSLFKIHFT